MKNVFTACTTTSLVPRFDVRGSIFSWLADIIVLVRHINDYYASLCHSILKQNIGATPYVVELGSAVFTLVASSSSSIILWLVFPLHLTFSKNARLVTSICGSIVKSTSRQHLVPHQRIHYSWKVSIEHVGHYWFELVHRCYHMRDIDFVLQSCIRQSKTVYPQQCNILIKWCHVRVYIHQKIQFF